MTPSTRHDHLTVAGLGTLAIGSAVGDVDVVITYQIPGPVRATTSRGSTLDHEPWGAGALMADALSSSQYRTDLKVSDLAAGDHIYTVAATIDGKVVTGSTIFTIPAA